MIYAFLARAGVKIGLVAVTLALLVGGCWRLQNLQSQRDSARAELAQALAEIEVQQANAEFSRNLAKQAQQRAVARSKAVQTVKGGIAHVDVPEACKASMAPLRTALSGVLSLQAAELRVSASPGPVVRR